MFPIENFTILPQRLWDKIPQSLLETEETCASQDFQPTLGRVKSGVWVLVFRHSQSKFT